MDNFIKRLVMSEEKNAYKKPAEKKGLSEIIDADNLKASIAVYELCSGSTDVMVRKFSVCDVGLTLVMCEAMFSSQVLNDNMIKPLINLNIEENTPQKLFDWISFNTIIAGDQKRIMTYGELFQFAMSGFVVILVDGIEGGIACGLQGYQYRSVGEPAGETNIRGSREGFVESIRVNLSMIRRRLKTPDLKFEMLNVGDKSKTDICLVYRTDCVNPEIIKDIKHKLTKISIDNVLDGGYLQPFLDTAPLSIFSSIGTTERPDTVVAKVSEGRVAIVVDGTPFVLTLPCLFAEHFQTVDDYTLRPYFATIIRWIKYIAFLTAILLPGSYVAISAFHPELLPTNLIFNIAAANRNTPFSPLFEAFIIHLFYEILREAGLRLPKSIGHAVSIVGGFVIGDAAVRAGLVGAPMVIIVALTAITAFVVPNLYEPVMIMRFSFIFLGGILGLYGIALGLSLMFLNLSAVNSYGIPSASPISPMNIYSMRDMFLRVGWKSLSKENFRVQDVPGSERRDIS